MDQSNKQIAFNAETQRARKNQNLCVSVLCAGTGNNFAPLDPVCESDQAASQDRNFFQANPTKPLPRSKNEEGSGAVVVGPAISSVPAAKS